MRLPIIDHTYAVLFWGLPVQQALEELLAGAPRDELAESPWTSDEASSHCAALYPAGRPARPAGADGTLRRALLHGRRGLRRRGVAPYPNVPANRYGVNAFLDQDVYDWQLQRDFSAIQAAGFGWVRQEFIWDQIEPEAKGNHVDTKNHVDAWAKWDRIVDDAQQYHVQLIVRLDYAPAWATAGNPFSGQCPTICPPPNNPQDFADFASAVASRYKGKIAAYQIWNEPNLQHEWAGKPLSPAAYTALLKAGYTAIKAADPAALVLSAALAPNRGDSPDNMADPAFLQGMYAAGAAVLRCAGRQRLRVEHARLQPPAGPSSH